MSPMRLQDRYHGALLGLACGDAVGTTVEFKPRGSFPPVTDMQGGGPFALAAGQWTDDTSMALCLAESLHLQQDCDPADQMQRYVRWFQEGYWSATGSCFDIGIATRSALTRYLKSGDPLAGSTQPNTAGNGSIMRLAPVAMVWRRAPATLLEKAELSSRTTHGARSCLDACRVLGVALARALDGADREQILDLGQVPVHSEEIRAIAAGSYRHKEAEQIKGSGYVVESLEAALWCFSQAEDFADAVLTAVNLGDDADTTGAIVGQLAGAHFGATGIPAHWLERLHRADDIRHLANCLLDASQNREAGA